MKIITKQIETWKIDDADLPKEVKSKILDKHSDINTDYEWWDFPDCYFPTFCKNSKIHYFDLNRGSFVQFSCDFKLNLLLRKFYNKYPQIKRDIFFDRKSDSLFIGLCPGLSFQFQITDVKRSRDDSKIVLYFPEFANYSDTIEDPSEKGIKEILKDNKDNSFFDLDYLAATIYSLLEFLENEINPLKLMREDYEYKISDEAIIETLKANDYNFDEYGDIVNE